MFRLELRLMYVMYMFIVSARVVYNRNLYLILYYVRRCGGDYLEVYLAPNKGHSGRTFIPIWYLGNVEKDVHFYHCLQESQQIAGRWSPVENV